METTQFPQEKSQELDFQQGPRSGSGIDIRGVLLNGDGLGEVARLVDGAVAQARDVVGEELARDGSGEGGERVGCGREEEGER